MDELPTDAELIDNAAACSQHPALIPDRDTTDESLRECIVLNVCKPLRQRIAELETGGIQLSVEEAGNRMALHQQWIDGEDPNDGRTFSLTCGAGLGSAAIWFNVTAADGTETRYFLDGAELVRKLMDYHATST